MIVKEPYGVSFCDRYSGDAIQSEVVIDLSHSWKPKAPMKCLIGFIVQFIRHGKGIPRFAQNQLEEGRYKVRQARVTIEENNVH